MSIGIGTFTAGTTIEVWHVAEPFPDGKTLIQDGEGVVWDIAPVGEVPELVPGMTITVKEVHGVSLPSGHITFGAEDGGVWAIAPVTGLLSAIRRSIRVLHDLAEREAS